MPMIDSDTFKLELDEFARARKALVEHNAMHTPANTSEELQFKTKKLLEEYHLALEMLAHRVKKQVEQAEG
ncbi:TPA: hypothetical protein ACUUEN_005520 [Pseudomonas aeruginosa]